MELRATINDAMKHEPNAPLLLCLPNYTELLV